MPAPPGLDIVIVSYRCRDHVRACLESLRRHPPSGPLQIHLIDNDSRDGTLELVRGEYPEVEATAAGRNLGFSAAMNIGIRRGSHRYVLALNPDTRVTEGAVDRLLALMEERDEVGACGCRLVRVDGSFDHAARRSFPTIAGALGHFTGVGRRARAPARLSQYRAPRVEEGPVDAINGAFMLLRRGALADVGLFDEGYWLYMEDLDLCYRLQAAGWTVWYEPAVTVVHAKGGSAGAFRATRPNIAFHYGMLRFYRLHYARARSPLVNAAVYAGIAVKLVASLVRSAIARRLLAS